MKEQISLLKQAADEIASLRKQNSIMSARLNMFDNMMMIFNARPNGSNTCGMGEDIAWKINKHIEEMEKENARSQQMSSKEGSKNIQSLPSDRL